MHDLPRAIGEQHKIKSEIYQGRLCEVVVNVFGINAFDKLDGIVPISPIADDAAHFNDVIENSTDDPFSVQLDIILLELFKSAHQDRSRCDEEHRNQANDCDANCY